ncbi:DUF5659 domain-containing protein [Anaerovorax odorimutans]|uniref:DUF5659 domain-containing protein n=1 Tax=Anaerovorax odorimutans TaxID=109327 RepID=UPI0003FE4CB5|nr:DUF5659 domain-containing protein [Anaerovorax odorimutans]
MKDLNTDREKDLKKPFMVFSDKLAAFLLINNIKLLRVRPDIQDFSKNVYIFKNSSEIETLIEDYNEQLALS